MKRKDPMLRHLHPQAGARLRVGAFLSILALAGAGCVNRDMSDLVGEVDKLKARKSTRIEPLPELTVPEVYVYSSSDKVDPFQPFAQEQPEQVAVAKNVGGIQPPVNHVREDLEYFPLDALRMVGTLTKGEDTWALVTAPDGAVHRVQEGNYMGRNFGKITLIAEGHIELMEIIPDGMGGWQERPAQVELTE